MAGTKRQLENGTWELCASCGTNLKGERIRRYSYTEEPCGPREADGLLAEFVAECRREGYSEGAKMLLKDYAPLWVKDYAEDQCRKKTNSRYNGLIKRIVEYLGDYQLQEIVQKPTLLTEFYKLLRKDGIRKDKRKINGKLENKKGGLSVLTVRHHHALLSSMFQTAVSWNLIKENPCTRVRPPREKRTEKKVKNKNYFTIEQAKLFLQALDNLPEDQLKYKIMVFLSICTGFRRSEIMGLEWSDVNMDSNFVSTERTSQYTAEDGTYEDETKNDSSVRVAAIPLSIMNMVQKYKAWWNEEKKKAGDKWIETNRLFIQWNGGAMHPDTISSWFPEFIRANSLPHVTFHGLRHTYGSILIAMGMNLEDVAKLLGHEDIQMLVRIYGHSVKKAIHEEAANIIDATLLQQNTAESEEEMPASKKDADELILPGYIPEDVKLLIEKLVSNYVPK